LLAGRPVAFEDEAQADEGEVRLVLLDRLARLQDERGQAARGYDRRAAAELGHDPADDPVDLAGEAVQDSRLQRLHRALADDVARTGQLVSDVSLAAGVTISPVFVRESDWLAGDSPFLTSARADAA